MKVILTCEYCGKKFTRYPSRLKRKGRGRFCSRECKDNACRKGDFLVCALCNNRFYRSLSEQDVGEKKNNFCSKNCYFSFRKIHMKDYTYPKIGSVHIHRIVAEAKLGRKLKKDEIVHHEDGDKQNNSPDNITVLKNQSEHAKIHFTK